MSDVCKIKVTSVNGEANVYNGTSKKTGKPYTVYTFNADCEIDGTAQPQVKLKTLSGNTAKEIKSGYECEAKRSEYNGQTEYTVERQQQSYGGGGGGGGGYSGKPFFAYTTEEYEALFVHALSFSKKLLGTKPKVEDIRGLASTYIISAVNLGIKVPAAAGPQSSTQTPPQTSSTPLESTQREPEVDDDPDDIPF